MEDNPIILNTIGSHGSFSLTCRNYNQYKETLQTMGEKGFFPIMRTKKNTSDGEEYLLIYNIFSVFPPFCDN